MTKYPPTIKDSLNKFSFLFKTCGFKIQQTRPISQSILQYRAVYIFNFLCSFVGLILALEWLLEGVLKGYSFTQLSYVTPCLTFSFLGHIKSITCFLHESEINQLIDQLFKIEVQTRPLTNAESVNKVTEKEINLFNQVTKWLSILNALMIVFFNVGPLVMTASAYFSRGEVDLQLPFLDVYPFDALDIRYWPFAYVHQMWCVCIVLCSVGSMDCILFTCCTYLRTQFKLIKMNIEAVVPDMPISQKYDDINFDTKLTEIIVRHQEVIRLTNLLEEICSKSILLNFITSSIVICFTGFNVSIFENFRSVLQFSLFLFMSLLQVFSLCYFGDSLMRSSTDVSEAVYTSYWYMVSRNSAKKLLFVQTRAQNPCKLTAAKFANVNLNSFMRVLSTAWSYFALLKTMYAP